VNILKVEPVVGIAYGLLRQFYLACAAPSDTRQPTALESFFGLHAYLPIVISSKFSIVPSRYFAVLIFMDDAHSPF
jgi:hypothetical protein